MPSWNTYYFRFSKILLKLELFTHSIYNIASNLTSYEIHVPFNKVPQMHRSISTYHDHLFLRVYCCPRSPEFRHRI